MQIKSKWVALYSQTGSEIMALVERGCFPDVVVTDNFTSYLKNQEFFEKHNIEHVITVIEKVKSKRIARYDSLFKTTDIVTLHGWLNIVPGEIYEKYTIYNGHPGHIVEYPELKGKDPQEKVWKQIKAGDLPAKIGSVIHRVTEEVDGGEVVVVAEMPLDRKVHIGSLDGMFNVNSYLSLLSWCKFFRNLDIILQDELSYDGTSERDQHIPIIIVNHE